LDSLALANIQEEALLQRHPERFGGAKYRFIRIFFQTESFRGKLFAKRFSPQFIVLNATWYQGHIRNQQG